MPIYSVKAPDGQIYEVRGPENATEDQILAAARAEYLRSRPAPKEETTGFTAAASAGLSRLKGDIALLGGKLGVMRPEEAEAYQKAREEEARKRFTGSEWSTAPGTKIAELFGGSVPYMAAPLAVGAAAASAPVSGALGLGALTAGALGAGAASATQFTASNLAEQMKTGKRLEETSGGAAVAAAIPQALLDVGSTLLMPGIGRLLGRAGAQVTEEAAAKLAQQTFRQKVVDYAARTGLSSTVEGTTEAAQEVLAKLQAGQNIADPEARADYVENFLGGAAMAAVLGPFGRAADRGRIIREGRALTTARENKEFEAQQAQERAAAPQRLSELEAAQEQLRAQLAQERDPANIAELGRQGVEQAREIKRLREMLSISISEPLTEAAVVAHQKRIAQTQAELLAAQQKGDFAAVGRITDKLTKLTESPLNVSMQGPPDVRLSQIGPPRDVFELQEAAKIGPQVSDISPEIFVGARPIPELVGPVQQAGPVAAGDPRFRYLRSLEAEYDQVWAAQQSETDPAKLRDLAQQGLAYEKQIGELRKELEGVTEFPPTFEELQEKHNAAVARAQKALDTAKEQRDPQAMLKALTRLETLQANAPKPEGYQLTEEELAQQKAAQEQAEAERKAQEDALKQQEADSKVAQEAAGLQRIGIYGPTLNVAGVARQARQTELDRVAAGPPPYMEQGLLFEPGLTERVNPPLAGEAPRQLVSLVGEAQRLPGADDVSTPVGQLVRSIDDAMLNLARTTPTTETIKQGDKTFERTVDPRRDAIDLLRGLVQNKGDLSVVDPALLRRVNESLLEIDKARRSETEQVLTTENRPTTPSQQAALEKMANISGTETAVPGSATETGVELKQRQGLEERGVTPALVSTGEVRKAVQLSFGKKFSAPARAFNDFNEFNNYLAGDALAELRKVRMGPDVLETMSRLDRMLPGMDARVRELEAEVARLNALEAEITKGSVRDRANTDAEIEKKKAQIERLGKQIADVLGKTQFSYLNAGQKLADARTRAEQLRGDIAANQEKLSALKTGESAAQGIESMFDFGDLNETLINRYEAQDAALRQELSALNRSFGGLTAARTRAATALEAAGQSPRITELNRYWEKTKGNMTLAEQTFANREAAREEQRAALVEKRAPVEAEAEARGQEAESLRERARQRIEARVPPAEKPAFRVTPEQAALERAAEPTTPEGKPIPRTTVEFKGRKQTLEGIVKQQEMTEAARGVEPGTAAYEPGRAAMQLRLEAVDKDIKDKTARISDLTDSINNIDKLDPKPFYNERDKRLVRPAAIARADERVRTQRLAAMMEERAQLQAEVRQAQGIKRTLQPTKAEKAASEARTREAIAGTPMSEEYEPILKTQTKKRMAAPLVRATTFAPTFRTGEEGRTAASTGLGKSTRPKQAAPSPVSKGKVPLTEEQKKAAVKLAREKAKLARQQFDALKSLQDYVENRDAFDDRGDDYGRLTEGYASRATQELDADTATALERGETVAALESLAQNGSTEFVRTLAQRLLDVIGSTTKVKVADGVEVNGQAAEGAYDAAKRLIELDRNSMTEEALTHEATHAATVQTLDAYEKGEPLTAEQQRAAEELDKLYQSMKKQGGLADEYGMTNLKEFAAEVMSNKDLRARLDQTEGLLKRIYNAFLRLIGFDPKTVSEMAVDNVYKLFAPNTSTSNTERMASLVRGTFFNTGPKFAAGTPESVKKAANAIVGRRPGLGDRAVAAASGLLWRTKALDRWAPVEALIKMGVAKGKISEAQALQARINMRMLEQRSQLVGTAVVDGVPQLSKADKYGGIRLVEGREGANLRKMLDALKDSGVGDSRATEEMFSAWMAALRAEKEGVGLAKLNYDLDPAEVATIKSYVESQPKVKAAFEKARQIYKQYNRDLLTLLVDTGTMERAKMEQLLQGDFVPYYRVDNKTGMVQLELGPTKTFDIGNIIDQPELKELVGGNQKILPIFNGAVNNTAILISMATKNLQTREVAYMLKQLGLGEIRPKEGKANSPRFKENGVLKHVAIDPDAFPEGIPAALLIDGMQGIQATVPGIVKMMGVPAQILRKWVMRTPLYPLRQVIRDSAHAWLTTGGSFTPVLSSFAEFGRMVTGTSNVEQILQRSGVISSNVYTGDTGDYVKLLKDMKTTSTFGTALAKLDAIAQQGDAATRAVVYESFRKQGMSHPEALLNTLESMNFSRRGTSASLNALSSMIPFFHSSLQGLDAVYRSFKGDTSFEGKMNARSSLLKRGMLLSGMTMAYAAMMQDDEAYKNATPDQRLMNWFVRLPGLDEPIRVPIPFELGLIFKSIPETIINVAFGDTKAMPALKALGQQALRSLPGGEVPLPTAIKPVLEVMMNHSLFNDQPIESMRERGMDVSARYRVNTTGLAKALGEFGVLSPVQIEHLIRGYTGNLFLHMSSVVDVLLRPTTPDAAKQPARNLSELPLVGGLFQPNTARGVIDQVFKEVEKSQQAKRTYDRLLEEGRDDEAEKYANQFGMRIALNSTGGTYRQQMGEFAKQRRAIAASDATPEEKRLQLLDLRKIEIEYASAIKEVFSEAE